MKLTHGFGDRFGRCRNEKAPTTEVMGALVSGLLKKRAFNNSYSDPNLSEFINEEGWVGVRLNLDLAL